MDVNEDRKAVIRAMGGRLTANDDAIVNRLVAVIEAARESERVGLLAELQKVDYSCRSTKESIAHSDYHP